MRRFTIIHGILALRDPEAILTDGLLSKHGKRVPNTLKSTRLRFQDSTFGKSSHRGVAGRFANSIHGIIHSRLMEYALEKLFKEVVFVKISIEILVCEKPESF